jgi:integrase
MAKSRNRPDLTGIAVYRRGEFWAFLLTLGPDSVSGERRRRYGGGYATEKIALAAAVEAKQSVESGTDVAPSQRSVSAFFTEWLDTVKHELKPSSYVNYRDYVHAYVNPAIGNRNLHSVDVPALNALYRKLLSSGRLKRDTNAVMYEFWAGECCAGRNPSPADVATACETSIHAARKALTRYRRGRIPQPRSAGLAPKTVRNVHRMLHRAFRDAVAWRYMKYNPAAHASLPRAGRERGRPVPWTTNELGKWLQVAMDDRDGGMWVLAATTGMRRSELAGVQRDHLDLDAAILVIDPTRIVVAGRAQTSDGKTTASRRTISLDRFTVAQLRKQLARLDEEAAAWEGGYDPRGFLFCHPDGSPVHPDTITRRFNRLVDRAGAPQIRLHDVRHTYATLSLDAGIDPKILSDRVGHANMSVTLQIYAHRSTGRDRSAAETFAATLFELSEDDPAPT